MPAVNPAKLKRLLIKELFLEFALRRRLAAAQLEDLVNRATADPRFDLSAYSDEFAGYMNVEQATDWAMELERAGDAPHIFAVDGQQAAQPEKIIAGVPASKFVEMPPEKRLALVNKAADEERRNANKK
jgi:hypothetical protein